MNVHMLKVSPREARMAGMLDPLDDAQRALVDLVWARFATAGKFPQYFYVDYCMRQRGFQAEAVLKSFPVVGSDLRADGYRAVDWWHNGPTPNPDGPVRLTIAGLHHVHSDASALICRGLLAYIRSAGEARARILDSPFEKPDLEVDLREVLRESGEGKGVEDQIGLIAGQEWPALRFQQHSGRGEFAQQLDRADFFTTDDYLTAVTAALSPPQRPTVLPYTEPRALLRAFNFLDITCELVLGEPLVPRPPMDRSSLLALDASTEAEFQTGVVVLTEIIGNLRVPGKNPSHVLGRIEQYLVDQLAGIDRDAVHQAVEALDQIRVVRNSFVHPKPSPTLIEAHRALGLAFPIQDFDTGWDSVRAHAGTALNRLQEEIQAART